MTRKKKTFTLKKPLFKSYYCVSCKQRKSCGKLDSKKNYCCFCYSQKVLEELEQEGLLISSAQEMLDKYRLGIIVCRCLGSEKTRVNITFSDGSGWSRCEKCGNTIKSAGHHGIIKNRNNPVFWGLEIKEKVLCGKCLGKLVGKMPARKKYTFNKYKKRGYWK